MIEASEGNIGNAVMFLTILSTAASFFSLFITEKQNNQNPDVLVPGFFKV